MKRIETVVIVHMGSKILLGLKNPAKKFGGKWNGFGGGVEGNESLEECAKRETLDETGLAIDYLEKKGIVLFKFEMDESDHEVHIYKADDYKGVAKTSKDFIDYDWFSETQFPDNMMPADKYWLPYFISGKLFKGEVCFDRNLNVLSYKINEVEGIE